jgi:5,5'-dehydrodivanillate O-demethylase oxygenase subunit
MLTQAENEMLTRVGPGTPAGELLRRYWHVAAAACELSEAKPLKRVRMFGEDLVLFRMPPRPGESETRYGLVGERCPHRLTSFKHGVVDCEGIRCIYHGWKFAPDGACIDMPAEEPGSTYKDRLRHRAYPVKKLAGLLFAYLGPAPAPELPRWDLLAREDGRRWGVIESVIDCNWLQTMENSVDPSHLFWLHGTLGTRALPPGAARNAVFGLPPQYEEKHEYDLVPFGIMKRRITPNRTPGLPPEMEQHPLVFPTGLRLVLSMESVLKQNWQASRTITPDEARVGYVHNMHFRTPIDDEHTMHYNVSFLPSSRTMSADEDPPFEVCGFRNADGEIKLEIVTAQDVLAWEAQGAIVDRSQEHLVGADRGVTILRKLLREQIEIVQNGGDPLGTIRDPSQNLLIDLDVVHEPFGVYRQQPQNVA